MSGAPRRRRKTPTSARGNGSTRRSRWCGPACAPTRSPRAGPSDRYRIHQRDGGVRPVVRAWPRPRPSRAADHLAAQFLRRSAGDQGRHGVRARNLLPRERRLFRRAHRGRSRGDAKRRESDYVVSGGRVADRESVLRDREKNFLKRQDAKTSGNEPLPAKAGIRGRDGLRFAPAWRDVFRAKNLATWRLGGAVFFFFLSLSAPAFAASLVGDWYGEGYQPLWHEN